MTVEILPTANFINILEFSYTIGTKATLRWEFAPDTFNGDLLDESGLPQDNPHQWAMEEEVKCTIAGVTFVGKIWRIAESTNGERVEYTAHDFIHELEKDSHEPVNKQYNSKEPALFDGDSTSPANTIPTQYQTIRSVLDIEFASESWSIDWDNVEKIDDKYPYDFVLPEYRTEGKTKLQLLSEVLAFNPSLSFYGRTTTHGKKQIVIESLSEFSKTTYQLDMRRECDTDNVTITTDASQKYNKVVIQTLGHVRETVEIPIRLWDDSVKRRDIDSGDYPESDFGMDKRPGMLGSDDAGVQYNPKSQKDRYCKYGLNREIFPFMLIKIGERDVVDTDPEDIPLNEDNKVDVIGVIGKNVTITGPTYVFDRHIFHRMAQGTKYDEDKPVNLDTDVYFDSTYFMKAVYQDLPPDQPQTIEILQHQDFGACAKFANVETGDTENPIRGVFWTNAPMVYTHKIVSNRTRAKYTLDIYREIGAQYTATVEDPDGSLDCIEALYPAKIDDLEFEATAKDGGGAGTKIIKTNYLKYSRRLAGETPVNPTYEVIYDDTVNAQQLANYYRDFYCRSSVRGSLPFIHRQPFAKLPFWLGWNLGIADGVVKSIHLENLVNGHTVDVDMESHHFGANEAKWDSAINPPATPTANKRYGDGAGSNTQDAKAPDFERDQSKQGMVGQLSKESQE